MRLLKDNFPPLYTAAFPFLWKTSIQFQLSRDKIHFHFVTFVIYETAT